jgi:hypothetical protein
MKVSTLYISMKSRCAGLFSRVLSYIAWTESMLGTLQCASTQKRSRGHHIESGVLGEVVEEFIHENAEYIGVLASMRCLVEHEHLYL